MNAGRTPSDEKAVAAVRDYFEQELSEARSRLRAPSRATRRTAPRGIQSLVILAFVALVAAMGIRLGVLPPGTSGTQVSGANGTPAGSPVQSTAIDPYVLGAARVSSTFGWVLTSKNLEVTNDGGHSWQGLTPPSLEGATAVAAVDPNHLVLGRLSGLNVLVDQTADGGATWHETTLPSSGQPGQLFIAASTSLTAVLVQQTTSANFSVGDLFTTTDGSAWQKVAAPVAGVIVVTGANDLWLAGGTAQDQLWHSADRGTTWTAVKLPGLSASSAMSIGNPTHDGSGRIVVPVTLNGATSQELFFASSNNGLSWSKIGAVTVGVQTGPGVALPAAVDRDGTALVVSGAPGQLMTTSNATGTFATVNSAGLPSTVTAMTFVTALDGWAIVEDHGCLNGKLECYSHRYLVATSDGGRTWAKLNLG
jgi:hypothetical protein